MAILSAVNAAVFLAWLVISPKGSHVMPWGFWVPILALGLIELVGACLDSNPKPLRIGVSVFGLILMLAWFAPYLSP